MLKLFEWIAAYDCTSFLTCCTVNKDLHVYVMTLCLQNVFVFFLCFDL